MGKDISRLSSRRIQLLKAVETEPATIRDLRNRCEMADTTIRDNLRKLRKWGLVTEDTDRRHRLTTLGQVTLDSMTEHRNRIAAAAELQPFLRRIEPDERCFDVRIFQGATIHSAVNGDPEKPTRTLVERLGAVPRFRYLGKVVSHSYLAAFREETGGTSERAVLAFPREVFDTASEGQRAVLRRLRRQGVQLRAVDCEVPFGVGLLGPTVCLRGYDDDDVPKVLVEAEAEPCREWADSYIEERLDSASEPSLQ